MAIYTEHLSGSLSNMNSNLRGNLNNQTQSLNGNVNGKIAVGTANYEKLINLPRINDVTIIGNKQGKDYKLIDEVDFITSDEIQQLMSL